MNHADLAVPLGTAESKVKRMRAKGGMPCIAAICRALALDFADLARHAADNHPLLRELTQAGGKAVVAEKRLLLMTICLLSQWTLEQVTSEYHLDCIGIIEFRPLNRYRLKLAKIFRWRPYGAVMQYSRGHALLDYFSGRLDAPSEGLLLVHGNISRALAPIVLERMQCVAQDFAQQNLSDQKLQPKERKGYTLLLAMRSCEFEALSSMRR